MRIWSLGLALVIVLAELIPLRTMYPRGGYRWGHRRVWPRHTRQRRPHFVKYYVAPSRYREVLERTTLFSKLLPVEYECLDDGDPPHSAVRESPKRQRNRTAGLLPRVRWEAPPEKKEKPDWLFSNNASSLYRTTPVPGKESSRRAVLDKQILDVILFVTSLFLLLNVIFVLGKCGCYGRKANKGDYAPLYACTGCNHQWGRMRCPPCSCPTIAEPCDLYCCETCDPHCRPHCLHTPPKRTSLMSRLFCHSCFGKACCRLLACHSADREKDEICEDPPPSQNTTFPGVKVENSEDTAVVRVSDTMAPLQENQSTFYEENKDTEDKVRSILKAAAKESSRGRIAADMALINAVNQISRLQGPTDRDAEREKRRVHALVQKALKDVRNFRGCDLWGEDVIIDQAVQKIKNTFVCSPVNHSATNLQFLLDLLHKASYESAQQTGNTEYILEATVDEIIKRKLIQETPPDFSDPATAGAPPEVRLRTYLKYQVAALLCAEPHQRLYVINRVYQNILRTKSKEVDPHPPDAPPPTSAPAPPVEIDHKGAKWLHLTAREPQEDKQHHMIESPNEMPGLLQKMMKPR